MYDHNICNFGQEVFVEDRNGVGAVNGRIVL